VRGVAGSCVSVAADGAGAVAVANAGVAIAGLTGGCTWLLVVMVVGVLWLLLSSSLLVAMLLLLLLLLRRLLRLGVILRRAQV